MSKESRLKTAYELAMERLEAQDRKAGVAGPTSLSKAQKKEITRLRQTTKAKLAEREILHQKAMAEAQGNPERLAEAEEHYRIDRRRAESALETAIEEVRERGAD